MDRYLAPNILSDLPEKMVLITGPRQVGKTTLTQQLGKNFRLPSYLNYDLPEQQRIIEERAWQPSSDYVVLDELHQMPDWKRYLKGVFDARPRIKTSNADSKPQAIVVTGSARLDTFRQSGESLAGRYFSYHLMPFSVKELIQYGGEMASPERALDALLQFSGFPEPLFKGSESHLTRWQLQYFTDLVREDILEFGRVQELRTMRLLLELLRGRTGSPLSYAGLAQDLAISPSTVRRYVDILQALHIVFLIQPYHRNIARALSKAPKLYFYDWTYLTGNPDTLTSAKLENLVAASLIKHTQFQRDSTGKQIGVHYIQTTSGKEIDFVLASENGELTQSIEVKLSDTKPSKALKELENIHPNAKAVQLVYQSTTPYQLGNVAVYPAAQWLAQLSA